MDIAGTTALVTGANRGIGATFVKHLLQSDVSRVYATGRRLSSLGNVVALDPTRVIPLVLDVTDDASVARAASQIDTLDLLINNAGVGHFGGALDGDLADLQTMFDTNTVGPLRVTRHLLELLEASGGAVINVISVLAVAPRRGLAGYSATKAALRSLHLSLGADLGARGIAAYGVFPAVVDTDMTADVHETKASPDEVVSNVLAAVGRDEHTIAPDTTSQAAMATWTTSPTELEDFMLLL